MSQFLSQQEMDLKESSEEKLHIIWIVEEASVLHQICSNTRASPQLRSHTNAPAAPRAS